MARIEGFAEFPARPPSVGEWEDVLVRVEITPRVVRTLLDGVPEVDHTRPREVVARFAAWEFTWQRVLDALRRGEPLQANYSLSRFTRPEGRDGLAAMLRSFERLRQQNFAAVQRRGVDVWEWIAAHPSGPPMTAYRLLRCVARRDAGLLNNLREAVGATGEAC